MEFNSSINFLSVFVAAFASFIFGWLWYGPLFGKTWAKGNKLKEQEMQPQKLVFHFLLTLITVLVLEVLFTGLLVEGFFLAIFIWIGFIATNRLGSMIWMKQSWTVCFIDLAYHLINLFLVVCILYRL